MSFTSIFQWFNEWSHSQKSSCFLLWITKCHLKLLLSKFSFDISHLCNIDKGSLKFTGSEIFVRSFPMKLLIIDHSEILWLGLSGTRVLLFVVEFPFTWSTSIVCRLSSICGGTNDFYFFQFSTSRHLQTHR